MSLADDVMDRAAELRRRGETFVVATVVGVEPPTSAQAGDKAVLTADGKLWGWVGGSCSEGLVRREAMIAMGDAQPRLVKIAPDQAPEHLPGVVAHVSTCPSAGSLDVFIDPQLPRPLLLVVGDTPAAHALIRLGATIGYQTCAVHPGATAGDFHEADQVIGSLDLVPARPNASTWAVVATMGHYDEDAIEALLPYDVAYIGLVASRRRAATVLDVLAAQGGGDNALLLRRRLPGCVQAAGRSVDLTLTLPRCESLGRADDWTNLDGAHCGRGYLGSVGDRLVLVLGLDDVEADDLLAAGGGRAGRRLCRSVPNADRRRRL